MRPSPTALRFAVVASLALGACAVNMGSKATVSIDKAPISASSAGAADGATALDRGDAPFCSTQSGTVGKSEPYHRWTFQGAQCDSVYIDLASRTGQDVFALLYEADEKGAWHLMDWNDDCAADTRNACITASVTPGRAYTVVATTYDFLLTGHGHGAKYDLTVSCRDAAGQCVAPVVAPTEGQACGSRGHGPCPEGQFCDFPSPGTSIACGAADGGGTCRVRPQACTKEYAPVCGCDSVTYANKCMAAGAGAAIKAPGECPRPGQSQGIGETCGGIAAFQCAEGLYCDYSGITSCYPDMGGACQPQKEVICIQLYKPECGCDGKTYSNSCFRIGAGAALAHTGKCEE